MIFGGILFDQGNIAMRELNVREEAQQDRHGIAGGRGLSRKVRNVREPCSPLSFLALDDNSGLSSHSRCFFRRFESAKLPLIDDPYYSGTSLASSPFQNWSGYAIFSNM